MRMLKLWVVVMLLGLLPVVSEAQEDINNAINVQLEYLKKYPKDKDALRKVSFLYLNKADYDQAIFYGRQLFEMGYSEKRLFSTNRHFVMNQFVLSFMREIYFRIIF